MKFYGQQKDIAVSSAKTGVLLVNLGTPPQAERASLRKYLAEFLMDPRVIELPGLARFLLVRGFIVNFRASKSAASYRRIWTAAGSPLLINTRRLSDRIADLLGSDFEVEMAMRYAQPSIQSKLEILHNNGARKLLVVPLYPQYSGSTTGSVFDELARSLSKFRWVPELHFVNSYYQRPAYISAVAESIKLHWRSHARAQKLLISFHGIPDKYMRKGDPYWHQSRDTALRIARELGLTEDQWMLVFQSRFGAQKWLQPYCEQTLKSLPGLGTKSVEIVCPGFSVDCLETLDEIDRENRHYFNEAGGESYAYIPCLNDSTSHAELIANIVRDSVCRIN